MADDSVSGLSVQIPDSSDADGSGLPTTPATVNPNPKTPIYLLPDEQSKTPDDDRKSPDDNNGSVSLMITTGVSLMITTGVRLMKIIRTMTIRIAIHPVHPKRGSPMKKPLMSPSPKGPNPSPIPPILFGLLIWTLLTTR